MTVFLDQTADVVYELTGKGLRRYPGNYTHYREEKLKQIRLQKKAYNSSASRRSWPVWKIWWNGLSTNQIRLHLPGQSVRPWSIWSVWKTSGG